MFILRAQLQHLAIVSWLVPSERVAAMLPRELDPDPIDDAGKWAVVSMAAMRDTTGHETYSQLNERTYVRMKDGSNPGAYFWKSHADTKQATLFRWLLGIPEFHDDVNVSVNPAGDRYTCTFEGQVVLELDLDINAVPKIPSHYPAKGITDAQLERAWKMSKNPRVGYTLDWGELCATPVAHENIVGRQVPWTRVDPSFMVPSIVLDYKQPPAFVAYQSSTPFYVGLPPRPVAGFWGLLAKLVFPWRV